MDQKQYITYGVIAIVAIGLGIGVGLFIGNRGGSENTYQAGWDAAKKQLAESGFAFPVATEIMQVFGTVTEMQSNGLIVKIRPIEPLTDPALDTRIVKVDGNTKFYRTVQKDPIAYQKEVQEYNRKIQQSTSKLPDELPNPPQLASQEEISLSDIKQNDQVIVTAAQNIKDAKEFIAATVSVQTAPVATPPLAPAPAR